MYYYLDGILYDDKEVSHILYYFRYGTPNLVIKSDYTDIGVSDCSYVYRVYCSEDKDYHYCDIVEFQNLISTYRFLGASGGIVHVINKFTAELMRNLSFDFVYDLMCAANFNSGKIEFSDACLSVSYAYLNSDETFMINRECCIRNTSVEDFKKKMLKFGMLWGVGIDGLCN